MALRAARKPQAEREREKAERVLRLTAEVKEAGDGEDRVGDRAMRRKHNPALEPVRGDLDAALAAMSTDELRKLVRDMLLELGEQARSRVINSLFNRAARGGAGWAPAALTDDEVAEVLLFAKAAARVGHADPSDMDEQLQRGSGAFLRKDYAAAYRIFGALLRPIGEGEIDLGQDEMVSEVLGADTGECAAQYVLSAYMLSPPEARADAVRAAIDEVQGVGHFWEPIRELERVAVEPLPGLEDFLPRWRALIACKPADERTRDWDTEEHRWLREVVQRLEGSAGLAKVARSTRRAEDLRAWCRSLVDADNWKAALSAFDEAAGLVAEKEYARAELLDGAALAAQKLGRGDLPAWLERAWRAGPSMLRLRRWLGSASGKAALRKRTAQALEACPKQASRQRAFLHLLQGDFESAAKPLATAAGLGWSDGEHPGHLLFPLFARLLGEERGLTPPGSELLAHRGMDLEELALMTADDEDSRLAAPEADALLRQAGIDGIPDATARRAVLAAMRKAAERRLTGVTEQKRRRYYAHAAELVAACVGCDPSPETAHWVAALRAEHRRFPALRAELDRALGAA